MRSHYADQASEHLGSSDPPTSASQSAETYRCEPLCLPILSILINFFLKLPEFQEHLMFGALLFLSHQGKNQLMLPSDISVQQVTRSGIETRSCSVPETGVQWCNHSSLQPQNSLVQVILPLQPVGNWDYRRAPACPANFYIFCRDGFSLCCSGWPQTLGLKQSSLLSSESGITSVNHHSQWRT
ncbi:hypothetical protein AAY473_035793 [Plecturocebus cupreus]